MSKSTKSPTKTKKPKLPYSWARDKLKKYQTEPKTKFIGATDLYYLDRLVDLRISQINDFKQKVLFMTPFKNEDPWMLGYYGTIFEEIDIEIKVLETLRNRLCHAFEEQCKEK